MARTVGAGAGREFSSDDFQPQQAPEIDASNIDEDLEDRKIHIEAVAPEVLKEQARMNYEQQLKFNEEYLEIYLYRSQHENSAEAEVFSVNGRMVVVPVETPCLVRRKFVEVMARSLPFNVRTKAVRPPNPDEPMRNTFHTQRTSAYTFNVIRDSNPRGKIWLEMLRQGA